MVGSPVQSALPNDLACDEVSVEVADPKPSVVAAQRARRPGERTARATQQGRLPRHSQSRADGIELINGEQVEQGWQVTN